MSFPQKRLIQPTIFAGTPTISENGETSFVMTAPALKNAYSPIVTQHTIVQLAPKVAPFLTYAL